MKSGGQEAKVMVERWDWGQDVGNNTAGERDGEGRTVGLWIMVVAVAAWATESGVDELMSGLVNNRVVAVGHGCMNGRRRTK